MNWLSDLVRKTSNKKKSTARPARRPSAGKRSSGTKKPDVRYYVKPSDNRVVTAHKKEGGPGYVYRKRTPSGIRNIPVKGPTFKFEKDAKLKAEKKKAAAKR